MDCVYLQTDQAQYWLEQTGSPARVERDFDTWIDSTDRRVAMIEVLNFDDDTHAEITRCCRHGDLVLLFIPEFIDDTWCREFDHPNVVMFLNGQLNWPLQHAHSSDCMYFFWSTCDFYRTFPNLLQELDGDRTRTFDVLLGRRKPHRDAIYRAVDHERNWVTYFNHGDEHDMRKYDTQNFIWPDHLLPRPDHAINFTVQEVQVDGVIVSLSQIIPRDIYRDTRYSLVAETVNENSFSFFTEKIVKPILAQRLFIVASGQYYLRNLRNLGFRTFDGVIDESYDLEANDETRMELMLEQVHRLENIDHKQLEKQIQIIVEHNYNVMMHVNWQNSMINSIAEYLK